MTIAHIRAKLRDTFGILPTLDLHGLGVKDALRETESFIREAHEVGAGSVRIVYGKGRGSAGGRGVLREVIPRWLDTEGRAYVRRYERRLDQSGVDGSVVVWIRDPEPDEDDEPDQE